jgi:hypothetical protein
MLPRRKTMNSKKTQEGQRQAKPEGFCLSLYFFAFFAVKGFGLQMH